MNTACALCFAGLLCALAVGPAAAAPGDEATQRAALATERRAIEARHAQRERACAERFVVTACLEPARAQRREALTELSQREAALDDAQRTQRAALRQQRLDAKRARQAADLAERASAPLLPLSGASAKTRAHAEPTPRPVKPAEPREVDAAERRAREQRARQAQALREEQAEERRRAAQERTVQRRASGKPAAAPLPPAGASAPG